MDTRLRSNATTVGIPPQALDGGRHLLLTDKVLIVSGNEGLELEPAGRRDF